ncbi:MAG: DUF1926 domain-containing protein [Deltaproteobacteria bacterium]|nr:DUF1926 domain-containing protein [Deltaproteobacteria bacterium]
MSQSLDLVVLLHVRLAPGLRLAELERLWKTSLQPLIGLLHHTPTVKVGVALGGEVLRALQDHYPNGVEWLRGMVDRGQVELVGAAFHEPVLHAIPEEDAVGQIRAHATLVKKLFGARPTGAWLPWGVWDPSLPRVLHKAAVGWTAVDERWIEAASHQGAVRGVYRTEREGMDVALLPVDSSAGPLVGRASIRGLLAQLRQYPSTGRTETVLALEVGDPSADPTRAQAWLNGFFQQLAAASPIVRTVGVTEYLERAGRTRQVYLPSAGPGGAVPWEQALARYPEANRLHKAMVRVSDVVNRLDRRLRSEAFASQGLDPEAVMQARRYLYQAQQAEAFSHGPYAGVYDPHRRFAAWRDILRAEESLLKATEATGLMETESVDEACTGVEQVVLRTDAIRALVDPGQGASLIGLRVFSGHRELLSSLTRTREPWHGELQRQLEEQDRHSAPRRFDADQTPTIGIPRSELAAAFPDWMRLAGWDDAPRASFVERFLGPQVRLDDLLRGRQVEQSSGLQDTPWAVVSSGPHGDDAVRTMLTAEGQVGEAAQKVRLHKRYTLHREPRLDVRLDLINRSHEPLRTRLAWELNLAIDPDSADDLVVVGDKRRVVDEPLDLGELRHLGIAGESLQVNVELERSARVWIYPVQTIHRDYGQRVTRIQGLCVILHWPVELWANEKGRFKASLSVIS